MFLFFFLFYYFGKVLLPSEGLGGDDGKTDSVGWLMNCCRYL